MTVVAAPRATPAERERLLRDFVRLCEIASPSGSERRVADAVAAATREAAWDSGVARKARPSEAELSAAPFGGR